MSIKKKTILLFVIVIFMAGLNHWLFFKNIPLPSLSFSVKKAFVRSLSKHANTVISKDGQMRKMIVLAMMDSSYTDMALNLYKSSFERFKITNYLFAGVGNLSCKALIRKNIHCFPITTNLTISHTSSLYGSKSFATKVGLRTEIVLIALNAGFSVLTLDVDHVFLQNPLPDIEKNMYNYDMMIMWDVTEYNTGFLLANPSNYTINVYEQMRQNIVPSKGIHDQLALNYILIPQQYYDPDNYKKHIVSLDVNKYLNGMKYFEDVDRNFPSSTNQSNNCGDCLVVHNNWIFSKEAKIYRFKEALMWWVDEDSYYSNQKTKYISYANPLISKPLNSPNLDQLEIDALKSAFAIAQMLDRILILPRFHCEGFDSRKECSLINYLSVRDIDKNFLNKYRENSFFLHDLIPKDLKKFNVFYNDKYSLKSPVIPKVFTLKTISTLVLTPNIDLNRSTVLDFSTVDIIEEESIMSNLEMYSDNVIHLTSLIGVRVSFTNKIIEENFNKLIQDSFVRKEYLQS